MTTRRTTALSSSATDILLGLLLAAAGAVLLVGTSLRIIPSAGGFSAFLLAAGVVGIAGALVGRTSAGFFSEIVSSSLIAVLGFVMWRVGELPLGTVHLVAGCTFAVNGVVRLASATEFPSLRGTLIVGGAASLGLAAAVFTDAVAPSLPNLGILVGVELVIDGMSALAIGRHQHPNRI